MKSTKTQWRSYELGAASINVELINGNIIVKHGEDESVLLKIKNVKQGSWDKIWEALYSIESAKQ
jgi:hypothetical protein